MVIVIGAGLAGCETTYQIAKAGIEVTLYEMKPIKFSEAHSNKNLAEVVCSNSFKSNLLTNACGLLKEELRRLDSLLIKCADETAVPAGQALAVDRDKYAKLVTEKIKKLKNVKIEEAEVRSRRSFKRPCTRGDNSYCNRPTYNRCVKQRDIRHYRRRQTSLL